MHYKKIIFSTVVLWAVAATVLPLSWVVSKAFGGDVVVIVHPNNTLSELSLQDLRMIYKGDKKSWSDGSKIAVFLPPWGSGEMQTMVENVFRCQDEPDVKKYYLTAIFQQKITTIPPSVINGQDAARKVADETGAIAVVKESEIMGSQGIKVIRVSGL